MLGLSLNQIAEWTVLSLVGSFFALRLLERGVAAMNLFFEQIWRGVELALGKSAASRIAPGLRRLPGIAAENAKTGLLIVVDPFIEVARSFIPEKEFAPEEAAAPQVETTPAVDTKPTKEEYHAATAHFGLSPNCPQSTAAKKWATLRSFGDLAREQEIDALWAVICAARGIQLK